MSVAARAATRWSGPDDLPVDPLRAVEQDPDRIRQDACRLVAPDDVCAPSDPSPPDPPSGGGSMWAGIFEIVVWVMFFAMVLALVFLLVRTLMTTDFARRRSRRRGRERTDDTDVEELRPVVVDHTREPSEWRREAAEHRAAGRYRDAVRCRYRALVGDLARRGLIDEIPGRTSGEERVQMANVAPAHAPSFASAAELFDDAWYGDVPLADADVQRMEALEERVLSGVGAPTP
jgi:hypothetical protein